MNCYSSSLNSIRSRTAASSGLWADVPSVNSPEGIKIVQYNLSYVVANDGILFNTNNHEYSKESHQPPDYKQHINKTNTSNWINLFHDNIQCIQLQNNDIEWMQKAYKVGCYTGKFPTLFTDELNDTCNRYIVPETEKGWFIRSNNVSLKCGYYGKGPYFNMREIIISIVTGRIGHSCFSNDNISNEMDIFFIPWKNIDELKEFRIFVCNDKITAISQQHIYKVNDWLNKLTESEINVIIKNIIEYYECNIKQKLLNGAATKSLRNYVIDLAILESGECYLIELNSFGKHYASGSALFHWLDDEELLNGGKQFIEFRYVYQK